MRWILCLPVFILQYAVVDLQLTAFVGFFLVACECGAFYSVFSVFHTD